MRSPTPEQNQSSHRRLRPSRRGVAAFKNSHPRPETTKNKTCIADLNTDVLRHIMLFVARSPDGPYSFARTLSVCKSFRELEIEKDTELLKCVAFGERNFREYPQSFWGVNGLISRCALAKNGDARDILLDYAEDRIEVLSRQALALEKSEMAAKEKRDALRAANTRGRKRAFQLALKESKEFHVAIKPLFYHMKDILAALHPISMTEMENEKKNSEK